MRVNQLQPQWPVMRIRPIYLLKRLMPVSLSPVKAHLVQSHQTRPPHRQLDTSIRFLLQFDTGFPNQFTESLMLLPVQFAELSGGNGPGFAAQALESGIDFWQFQNARQLLL